MSHAPPTFYFASACFRVSTTTPTRLSRPRLQTGARLLRRTSSTAR